MLISFAALPPSYIYIYILVIVYCIVFDRNYVEVIMCFTHTMFMWLMFHSPNIEVLCKNVCILFNRPLPVIGHFFNSVNLNALFSKLL